LRNCPNPRQLSPSESPASRLLLRRCLQHHREHLAVAEPSVAHDYFSHLYRSLHLNILVLIGSMFSQREAQSCRDVTSPLVHATATTITSDADELTPPCPRFSQQEH
jgi:hypothetical protein